SADGTATSGRVGRCLIFYFPPQRLCISHTEPFFYPLHPYTQTIAASAPPNFHPYNNSLITLRQ
ncbi:MAG: hypothetical protein LAT52_07070, partial [Balneolales bacterium]|nr:hypothetical protein [Balneolales bacterium]